MFYVWVYFGNRFKDMYLPAGKQFSETIAIRQYESGWDRDYFITVKSIEGSCFVSPAEKFHWRDAPDADERPVENGSNYIMEKGGYWLGVVFSDCERDDTRFRKFALPGPRPVTIGRAADCSLRVDEGQKLISSLQGTLSREKSGEYAYTDSGRNGSYINNLLISRGAVRLRFGDIITLSAMNR